MIAAAGPDHTLGALDPGDVYALQQLVACGRLYRFGAAFRLDRPCEEGDVHLIAAGRCQRLEQLGLARRLQKPAVPGSSDTIQATASGLSVCQMFGWRTVAREWNEMPQPAAGAAR